MNSEHNTTYLQIYNDVKDRGMHRNLVKAETYTCHHCGALFKFRQAMVNHFKIKGIKQKFSNITLEKTYVYHTTDSKCKGLYQKLNLTCKYCGKVSRTLRAFQEHIKVVGKAFIYYYVY
jgi:Zinc finger, C2H2 type